MANEHNNEVFFVGPNHLIKEVIKALNQQPGDLFWIKGLEDGTWMDVWDFEPAYTSVTYIGRTRGGPPWKECEELSRRFPGIVAGVSFIDIINIEDYAVEDEDGNLVAEWGREFHIWKNGVYCGPMKTEKDRKIVDVISEMHRDEINRIMLAHIYKDSDRWRDGYVRRVKPLESGQGTHGTISEVYPEMTFDQFIDRELERLRNEAEFHRARRNKQKELELENSPETKLERLRDCREFIDDLDAFVHQDGPPVPMNELQEFIKGVSEKMGKILDMPGYRKKWIDAPTPPDQDPPNCPAGDDDPRGTA